jgi:hypothetical protein
VRFNLTSWLRFLAARQSNPFYSEQIGESAVNCRVIACRGRPMEFTVLFLAIVVVMLVAWRGPRPLALGLFAFVMIACVATYLHHATDTLKLSF